MKELSTDYIPGLDGVPATRSSVSYLDGDKGILAYRGQSIFDLVEKGVSFEECAFLLIHGAEYDKNEIDTFASSLREHMHLPDTVVDVLESIPHSAHPMEALSIGVMALSSYHDNRTSLNVRETSPEELSEHMGRQALVYLGGAAAIVAAWQRIRSDEAPLRPMNNNSFARNFLYMFAGKDDISETETRIIDTCLLLHAEHTINASTFASMVTGSTLAHPGFVVSTGINTLAGPLHGGANERVIKMIDSIGSVDKVQPWLDDALANKRVVWGMGHREYKVKDPRAIILQKMIGEMLGNDGDFEAGAAFGIALELEKLCEERLAHKGVFPNVDFYSGILYREMGIPVDQFTPIFAASRTAGWLAHWMEQVRDNRIFRPTQIYTGPTVE